MRKSRFSEEQIIKILKEQDAGGKLVDICRRHGISEQTFHRWKAKFGGMDVNEARRLKQLEDENRRLKHLVADLTLDNQSDGELPRGAAAQRHACLHHRSRGAPVPQGQRPGGEAGLPGESPDGQPRGTGRRRAGQHRGGRSRDAGRPGTGGGAGAARRAHYGRRRQALRRRVARRTFNLPGPVSRGGRSNRLSRWPYSSPGNIPPTEFVRQVICNALRRPKEPAARACRSRTFPSGGRHRDGVQAHDRTASES
jgi:putative transposase